MRIQKMQWAGILIEDQGTVLMVDPVFNSFDVSFFGEALEELYEFSHFKKPDVIAITHLHSDHFDPASIHTYWGRDIPIIVPKPCVDKVKAAGLTNVTGLAQGEAFHFDGFEVIAERSVDGLGDDQAAWIIKAQDHTLIHCGDTLWHGYWWDIAKKYGPIDAAFLPVNGAIVHEEGMTPSNQPICMEPEQALTAAKLLNCKLFVPIHYGTFCNPPIYNETRTPLLRLTEHSENFEVKVLQNKEEFFL